MEAPSIDILDLEVEVQCSKCHNKEIVKVVVETNPDDGYKLLRKIQRKLQLASMKPTDF